MRTFSFSLMIIGIALALAITGTTAAQQVQVDALADTGVFPEYPNNNCGAHTHVPVGVTNDSDARRSLFWYDIAGQVPGGATITNAVFEFDTKKQGGDDGQQGADYSLHRVTTEWEEGSGTGGQGNATFDGASWNDASVGIPWNTPGGDFDSMSLGTVFVDAPNGALDFQISSAELIAAVQDMLDNSGNNFGFMLKNVNESLDGSASRVVSREGSGLGNVLGTRLIIDYTTNFLLGDVNLDGVVNLLDVQPFVDLLVSGDFQAEADINQDGVVDLLDVQPFVDLLSG